MPSFDGLSRFTALDNPALYQEVDSKSGRLITCQVQGMSCTSCAAAVKEKLLGLTGVKLAHVDFLSGLTNIVLMKNVFRPPDILPAISELGYTAQLRPSGSAQIANGGDSDWNYETSVYWSLLLVIPILLIDKAPEAYLEPRTRQMSILVLSAFVQIAFGLPFYRNTTTAIRNNGLHHLPMDALITCSTTTAYVASIYFFLQQQTTTYAATSASLIVVVSLGKYLEARFKRVSMSAISAFANLLPPEALLVGTRKQVPVHSLKAGDRVVIKPGERFPCDGKLPILPGNARELQFEVDESLHTGEQHPVLKHAGDICLAGTINSSQRDVLLDVIHEGQNRLNEILDAIVQGQHYKSSLQSYVDEAAQYIVPGVLLCAVFAFLKWLPSSLDKAVGFMTATLVIACPCALGMSVPLAVMIGSGKTHFCSI